MTPLIYDWRAPVSGLFMIMTEDRLLVKHLEEPLKGDYFQMAV